MADAQGVSGMPMHEVYAKGWVGRERVSAIWDGARDLVLQLGREVNVVELRGSRWRQSSGVRWVFHAMKALEMCVQRTLLE